VLVATGVREGWGLVVSEAAACGTFAVGYDVPGLRDSLRATGGVACDPTPSALAEALDVHLDRLAAERPVSTGTLPWGEVAARLLAAARTGATLAEEVGS
jgi:glycosyltransferase involved in cell wall biosynthesis